jgi:hypothetical protein
MLKYVSSYLSIDVFIVSHTFYKSNWIKLKFKFEFKLVRNMFKNFDKKIGKLQRWVFKISCLSKLFLFRYSKGRLG